MFLVVSRKAGIVLIDFFFCVKCSMEFFIFDSVCKINILQHDVRTQNLTSSRINKTGAISPKRGIWRRCPTKYIVTNITCIPCCIIGLDFYLNSIEKTCSFKSLIPRQYPFLNCAPKFERSCVFNPPDNRFYGLRNTLIWVFLY